MPDIVILGAGLTGISAAYHLEQAGISDYKIFEKNSQPGGLLQSIHQDNFTFDYTGHLLHISNPYFRQTIDHILGLENLDLVQRQSAIHTHNTCVDYPFQMNLHGLPKHVIYDCIHGFINRKKSRKHPQTFYEWVLKHFGHGIGKHFFFPYNSKILAYDVKKIHPSWTGRFVPQTNLKAMLFGALSKKSPENVGYNSSFYYPKSGGIYILIKKFIQKLKASIKTNYNATSIDLRNKIIYFDNGHKEHFKYLISTMPLDHLLKKSIFRTTTHLKKAAEKLLCNSVINFNVGFDRNDISEKHWLYFPEKKYPFYRIGFWHNISPTAVKKGCGAIYGETAYLPHITTEKQKNYLLKKSIDKALNFLHLAPSNIVIQKILYLEHAYVIYDLYREKNLKKIHARLNEYNVYSTGRFGAWKYSSMQEAVLDGKQVAKIIVAQQICKPSKIIIPAITSLHPKEKNKNIKKYPQKQHQAKFEN